MYDALPVAQQRANWRGALKLGFRPAPGKTVLAERKRFGPLAVQRAFYPEGDHCHVYLLHPPGGVAGGDELDIDVHVATGSSALVTTPGATKFYRSCGPRALLKQTLVIDEGRFEWLPQENIFFPGANVTVATTVELTAQSRFIGWEINCLGRPVIDEPFLPGRAVLRFTLRREGTPLLCEQLLIDGERSLCGVAGLRGQPVTGTLYATVEDNSVVDSIRQLIPADTNQLGVTLVDGILVVRYLGDSVEKARRVFTNIWKTLRPIVMLRDVCEPRIWHT